MRVLFVSLLVVIADQLTKLLVKGLHVEWLGISFAGMPYGSSKQVIGNFARITLIENPGMAFGILITPQILLPVVIFTASIFVVYYLYRHRSDSLLLRLAFALILAGALGNLIDRAFYGLIYSYAPFMHGKVVDFIHIEFWDFTIFGKTYTSWPVLNIADLSVTCGFIIAFMFRKRIFVYPQGKQEPESSSAEPNDPEDVQLKEETTGLTPGVINYISPHRN